MLGKASIAPPYRIVSFQNAAKMYQNLRYREMACHTAIPKPYEMNLMGKCNS